MVLREFSLVLRGFLSFFHVPNIWWSIDLWALLGFLKIRVFEGFWAIFVCFLSFFWSFSIIACAKYPGPEVKSHFGVSRNKGFCKVFLGAFEVVLLDFG
jgi:hypothetical protein